MSDLQFEIQKIQVDIAYAREKLENACDGKPRIPQHAMVDFIESMKSVEIYCQRLLLNR